MSESQESTKLQSILERVRHNVNCCECAHCADAKDLLAEHDRLRAELDRLTVLRPASEHGGLTRVLVWTHRIPYLVVATVQPDEEWTPLPTPKQKDTL